ncbi:hypothetical protein AMS68_006889 [Peltaster fructicola]|uniref:Uncharacterized protein n=1 Tax=Peltaster fructicola TaxID=286661 RepID=A0A6H0Y2X4_9PEZI|nr:hypothetical protein AMS68_006889 [Peltaster fructicola]
MKKNGDRKTSKRKTPSFGSAEPSSEEAKGTFDDHTDNAMPDAMDIEQSSTDVEPREEQLPSLGVVLRMIYESQTLPDKTEDMLIMNFFIRAFSLEAVEECRRVYALVAAEPQLRADILEYGDQALDAFHRADGDEEVERFYRRNDEIATRETGTALEPLLEAFGEEMSTVLLCHDWFEQIDMISVAGMQRALDEMLTERSKIRLYFRLVSHVVTCSRGDPDVPLRLAEARWLSLEEGEAAMKAHHAREVQEAKQTQNHRQKRAARDRNA